MLLIKNGYLCDEKSEGLGEILIEDGVIAEVAKKIPETSDMQVIDAQGLVVSPGLVDMHVHLRDPGYEYKEDIITGAAAAAAGGVTTCCCMPNTLPVADNAETVRYIVEKAAETPIKVLPYGAVTMGQQGAELTDFAALKAAGAVGLSDDGNSIQNAEVTRRAMKLASECGLLLISHCEDADMVRNYAVNEGAVSRELGIPGRPAIAEEIMIARDIMLAAETGARLHIAHVSTKASVDIIRYAKKMGVDVTAETCPQYFTLTEDEVLRQGALARVNPPLRTADDVEAIIRGLKDGTIDAIASDHAPHSLSEKALPLVDAPSGMIGLETLLALTVRYLYYQGDFTLRKIIALLSTNPAGILGLNAGTMAPGSPADLVIYDSDEDWTVDPEKFKSKARNTPYTGMTISCIVKYTISQGNIVYKAQGMTPPV